ncbi:hypothetical protein CPT_Mater176 [Bacillus phage Mater]|uniref:Uncharacterized protein n=1 Tax=Bacillus phage Mater TaxID=1540090 RepID=A0A0A0RUS6_9CAUD|nr:hypothetical protein CPT_Mater176 [Bacillus phage Mater]AIW03333.1 hypothetical protein CPT_Mater176 [Bacillus phage Mater]
MARKKARRPKLFQNAQAPKQAMKNVGNALVQKTLDAGMKAAQAEKPKDAKVVRKPKYLEVTETRMNKLGVIDLKPYFSRSSHKVMKKGGGWYLRVPIKRKKKDMSKRMYTQLRTTSLGESDSRTIISDYLYDRRRASGSNMLDYSPKSYNITRQKTGSRKSVYIAYRTVSNNSPASSWIINRDRVNSDDTSKTFVRNMNRLMKWKMKNGWE